MGEEGLQDTPNKLIHIGRPIEFNQENFKAQLNRLREMAEQDSENIKDMVREMVPTYIIKTN